MLRTAVVAPVACPDTHVLDSKTGHQKKATPEADEWASKSCDVARGAPGLHEQTPIRDQREVEIEEQTENSNSDNPALQCQCQVGPPDP